MIFDRFSMSRDYKTHPNSSFPGKNGNTLLLGLFIGYALGLLTAIGTWMYINQAPSPFISQDKLADNAAAKNAANQTEKELQGHGDEARQDATAAAKQ